MCVFCSVATQSPSIILVRLIPHGRKSGIDLPRFHAHDIEPCIRQTVSQVLRERASFEPHLMGSEQELLEIVR